MGVDLYWDIVPTREFKFYRTMGLPFQMPSGMTTVEKQFEDVPRDMEPFMDSEGNIYDFAYGLNWKGVINDERVKKHK